jgi:HK97 family phage major capsid protein
MQKAEIDHAVDVIFTEAKGRVLTDEEKQQLDGHAKKYAAIEKRESDERTRSAINEALGLASDTDSRIILARGREVKSAGQEFIESKAGQWFKENKGSVVANWMQMPNVELKATLLESGITGGPLTVSEFSEGGLRFPPLPPSVADLIAPGTLTGNAVGYLRQTPTANPATTVAEGAAKPEATLTFAAITDPLRKIATWLPVSDEFLEDVPALRSFIDAQLRIWVREAADNQILNGDGVAPNLLGLLNVPGIGTLAQGSLAALDALALALAKVQTDSGFVADGIVLNATDWEKLRLVKDSAGNYLGGNPFGPPAPPTLWGRPVVPTPKIAVGSALVGAFRIASQLFTKGGIQLAASNSHQDFFVKNLTAIRAEVRAALAVYRPSAFVEVTGLTAPAAALATEEPPKRRDGR